MTITADNARKLLKEYNDEHGTTYVLVLILHYTGEEGTYKHEPLSFEDTGLHAYCKEYKNSILFYTIPNNDLIFDNKLLFEIDDMDVIESLDADNEIRDKVKKFFKGIEDKTQREIEEAMKAGRIYIDANDYDYWKIYDTEGNCISLNYKDFKIIQEYLDKLYCKRSDIMMWSFHKFVYDTMCHECVQKCDLCPIQDLKHAISRRIPAYDD